jgi:hypothetical protein
VDSKGLLQRVLRVVNGPEDAVAVQLQVVPVRLDELAKRSSSPARARVSRSAVASQGSPSVLRKVPIGTDPARDANWAVPGRPVSGPAGVYLQ